MAAGAFALVPATISAQEVVVAEEFTFEENVPCRTVYSTTPSENWFLEIGAGINTPFVENDGETKRRITANYGVGFGKWFSPFFGWRMEFQGGSLHWNNPQGVMAHAKSVNGNIDIMWDMFNSMGGVSSKRVFSIVPFLGIGATYNWKYKNVTTGNWADEVIPSDNKGHKINEWLLPVSAGIQFRFRLCKYVDFFLQARASFYSDCFNQFVWNRPVDVNLSCLGGLNINFGGREYHAVNPCDYSTYIDNLNNQINVLREENAGIAAALANALANPDCPEVAAEEVVVVEAAPLLASVRFTIDSYRITNMEKLNVYNVAEWMKANPDQNVIVTGYADKNTGTAAYNMTLSEKRANAVKNMLVNTYGIAADRLTVKYEGSSEQPYPVENNWNRVVTFEVAE